MYPKNLNHLFKDQYDTLVSVAKKTHPVYIDKFGEPWILGKRGSIGPYNSEKLSVYTDKPKILNRYRRIDYLTPHQIGDEEGYFLFHIKDFGKVNRLVGLKRKRVASVNQLANLRPFQSKHVTEHANLG